MKKSILFLFVLSTILVLQSCEEGFAPSANDNPENLVAPAIPPVELLMLPTTTIDDMEENIQDDHSRFDTYDHWLHAGLSLLGWNTIVVVNLAVPTAAIAQAFNVQAKYIGNSTFEWAYTYAAPQNQGGKRYTISLTGQYLTNNEIEWKLTASQIGGFSNFLWYSAIIANDHSYADFTLNRNPNNPESLLAISYIQDFSTADESLRFTNIVPSDPNKGNYIEYRVSPTSTFNRAFELQGGPNNILYIEWDKPSNVGRVKHELHFGDGQWHCWNEKLIDIDC